MFEEHAAFIISLTVLANSVTFSSVKVDLFKSFSPLAGEREWFWKILISESVRLAKRELLEAISQKLKQKR